MAKDKSKDADRRIKAAEAADADGRRPEGEGEEGGKKKLPLRMLIIAGVGALVVLGGGGTARRS